jgi:hypothetical protein
MKKFALSVVFFLAFVVLTAQIPAGFSYQAVVRNNAGEIIGNKAVKFKFSIIRGTESSTPVYIETQSVTTNNFGLANVIIGKGTPLQSVFSSIEWDQASHFLRVELDASGGSDFVLLGTIELMSVPYAFHAQTVENDLVNDADADSTNEIQELSLDGNVLSLSPDGGSVELPSSGTGAFVSGNGITRNTVLTDDFVFGSSSLDDITGSDDNKRMFFNKSKGAFRAGEPYGTDWDDANVGNTSAAFGNRTKASGLESFTSGHVTNASGLYSTSMGAGTHASGMASTALGGATTAYGDEATSVGYKTLAWAKASLAAGQFNVGLGSPNAWVLTDPVFEIGIGTSETDKANAVTVLKNGNVGIGPVNPVAKLEVAGQVKITGGNPGAGKVLTSDTGGLASWQTASGGFVLPYSGDYGGADAAFSINQSGTGNAIYVYNPNTTAEITCISAHTNSSSGTGISGYAHSETGSGIGISGGTSSPGGIGVKGNSNATGGVSYGIVGESSSIEGVGVWGYNTSTTGITYGVQGKVSSPSGYSGFFIGGRFVVMGDVGIGSSFPSAKLEVAGQVKITGGIPGLGKVLTSDANGLASWETPASNPWQTSGSNIYFNTGNIGIGTASPAAKLDLSANQGPNLIIRDSDGGSGRPGIQFVNNNIHYIGGDDGSEEVFGFYSGYGSNRTYAAKLNVHGPATNNWGKYIGLTHDGNHGRIYTDAGYLILEPAEQRVGLGTDDPTQSLDVNGNARFRIIASDAYYGVLNRKSDGTLTTATSDERLKENINSLQNSLDKIMQLRGVSFTWKSNPEYGTRIGFIAQEFEKVIPELVYTNEVDGYKGINYAEATAVIVEAVKEQQKLIEDLKAENEKLKAENESTSKNLKKIREEADKLSARLLKLESVPGTTAEK